MFGIRFPELLMESVPVTVVSEYLQGGQTPESPLQLCSLFLTS